VCDGSNSNRFVIGLLLKDLYGFVHYKTILH